MYELSKGEAYVELSELDMKHLVALVLKDLKYLRSRSAARSGNYGDANASKIENRQRLVDKLETIQRKE